MQKIQYILGCIPGATKKLLIDLCSVSTLDSMQLESYAVLVFYFYFYFYFSDPETQHFYGQTFYSTFLQYIIMLLW